MPYSRATGNRRETRTHLINGRARRSARAALEILPVKPWLFVAGRRRARSDAPCRPHRELVASSHSVQQNSRAAPDAAPLLVTPTIYFVASFTFSPAFSTASPVLFTAFSVPSLVFSTALSSFSPAVSSFLQPCPRTSAAASMGQIIKCFILYSFVIQVAPESVLFKCNRARGTK